MPRRRAMEGTSKSLRRRAAATICIAVAVVGLASAPLFSWAVEDATGEEVVNFVNAVKELSDDLPERDVLAVPVRKEDKMGEDIARQRAMILHLVEKSNKAAKRSKSALLALSVLGGAMALGLLAFGAKKGYQRYASSTSTDEVSAPSQPTRRRGWLPRWFSRSTAD